eukprot:IDg22981t1
MPIGASRVAISEAFSYAIVIHSECVDVISLVDGESVRPGVGNEGGAPLTVGDVRAPGRRTRVRRVFTTANIGEFDPQFPLGD